MSGSSHTDTLTLPDGRVQETTYTINNGQVASLTRIGKDINGHVVTTENRTLDGWGNTVTITDVRTGTTTFVHDEGTGTLISQTEPNQSITSYQYDDFGRQVRTVLSDGSEQYIDYDAEGRIIRQWGSQQYPVSYKYDAYGQKIGMATYRVPVGETAAWPEGAEGDKTTWAYDASTGNLIQKIYADGQGLSYTYTPGGKLQTETNTRGNVMTYSYDLAGQLVSIHVNDNGMTPTKMHSYDQIGRIITATTEGVATYQYHYNDRNQVIEEQITIPTGNGNLERNLVRSYDAYGRAIGYQLQQGDTVEQEITYIYTPAGQLDRVMADGKEFIYSYLTESPQLVAQVTSPVHTVTNTYEANRDILTSKVNRWKNKMDNSIISAYTYMVNNLGQRVSVATEGEAFGSTPADWMWGYDALGQVASANSDHYAYDQIGNRKTSRNGDSPETVYYANALNQYANIGSSTSMYDADGNLLSGLTPTTTLPDRNALSFTYNAENRPISVSKNGKSVETYSYDHMGRRIKKGDTITLYEGYNAIAEYKEGTRSLKMTYAWSYDLSGTAQGAGGVGGLLSVTEHDKQLPVISYPCYDGNGNISEYLTEEYAGTVTTHYEYDSFGNVIRKIGNKEYIYQFSTKPYDVITGLNYYNYRNYDPLSGRWIFRDPSEENGGVALFVFSNNNPIENFDYLGLCGRTSAISFSASEYLTIYPGVFFGGGIDVSVEKDTCDCCFYGKLKLEVEFGLGIKLQKNYKGTILGYGFGAGFGFEASYAKTKAVNDNIEFKYCPETGEASGGGDISLLNIQLGGEVGVNGQASLSAPGVKGALSASGSGKLVGYATLGALVEVSGPSPKVDLYGQAGVNIMYSVSVSGQLFIGPIQIGEKEIWKDSGSAFDEPVDTGKVTIIST